MSASVTPWPHASDHPGGVPAGSEFVCSFETWIGVDSIDEAAFLAGSDELWLISGFDGLDHSMDPSLVQQDEVLAWGLAVTMASGGPLEMLEALFRSRVGYGWPTKFLQSGSIGREAFIQLVSRLEAELEANASAAREQSCETVNTARDLRLSPRPAGTSPHLWKAACPGTDHHMHIDAEIDRFYCGWCKRGGGQAELAEFVAERGEE